MEVLIINGSPRTGGITATILHSIEAKLNAAGISTTFYDLSQLKMSHCIGCCGCYRTGHCHMKDDAEALAERIRECDGLILGSPTYASNVSGLMKDLIDRGHFVIEQSLHRKFCATVATGENYGNRDAGKVLNRLIQYSGGILSAKILMKAPFNGAVSVSHRIEKAADVTAKKLIRDLQKKKTHLFQRLFHAVIFKFGIRPYVRKMGDAYAGVRNKWHAFGINT